MNPRVRQQRSVFLLFLGACFVALIAALPIVAAQTQPQQAAKEDQQKQSAAAGSGAESPDFERIDRNKDGVIDKSEAGMIPGLSANFERADRSKDGKLDREEFERGLQILQVRR